MNKQTMQFLLLGLAGATAYLAYRFWQEKKDKEEAQVTLANEELSDQVMGQDTTAVLGPFHQKIQTGLAARYANLY